MIFIFLFYTFIFFFRFCAFIQDSSTHGQLQVSLCGWGWCKTCLFQSDWEQWTRDFADGLLTCIDVERNILRKNCLKVNNYSQNENLILSVLISIIVGLDGKFRPFGLSSQPQSLDGINQDRTKSLQQVEHRFPITNGSLYTSIDGRLPVIHNYRRHKEFRTGKIFLFNSSHYL